MNGKIKSLRSLIKVGYPLTRWDCQHTVQTCHVTTLGGRGTNRRAQIPSKSNNQCLGAQNDFQWCPSCHSSLRAFDWLMSLQVQGRRGSLARPVPLRKTKAQILNNWCYLSIGFANDGTLQHAAKISPRASFITCLYFLLPEI